ncbi:MAG: hypothetical protein ABR979_01245 [Halobacteriota archaeon]
MGRSIMYKGAEWELKRFHPPNRLKLMKSTLNSTLNYGKNNEKRYDAYDCYKISDAQLSRDYG